MPSRIPRLPPSHPPSHCKPTSSAPAPGHQDTPPAPAQNGGPAAIPHWQHPQPGSGPRTACRAGPGEQGPPGGGCSVRVQDGSGWAPVPQMPSPPETPPCPHPTPRSPGLPPSCPGPCRPRAAGEGLGGAAGPSRGGPWESPCSKAAHRSEMLFKGSASAGTGFYVPVCLGETGASRPTRGAGVGPWGRRGPAWLGDAL